MVKQTLAALAATFFVGAASAATVNLTSTGNYGSIQNFTSCTIGSCANFLPTHNVTGSFTTSGPLPANAANVEIGSTVTSFSFASGLDVIASGNADARLNSLRISTDASGNITAINSMQAVLWTSGSAPHVSGNRFSAVTIIGVSGNGTHNAACQTVGTGASGVADTCLAATVSDTSRSTGLSAPLNIAMAVAPSAGTVAVPTLSQWGVILMAAMMGLFAFARLRRQR